MTLSNSPAAMLPTPYIISPRADLTLIVGAVLLCPAILLPMANLTSPYTVWLLVMTFGAVGHHLPSFLRTYGDRDLFQRYKIRLIVAPILLFAVTLGFSMRDLHGMLLISMCWSIWHGMMQHFGFLRIYDSKVKSFSPFTARLDWWMSFSWFGLALTFSPSQGSSLLSALYDSGIPLIPPQYMGAVQQAFFILTASVTLVFIYHTVRGKHPRSWLKLGLAVGTFTYVWIVRVITKDPFLSVALFELLHDVQYLAIVWAFNRNQVQKGKSGVLPRFFYLGGAASIAGYIGACLAYGAVAFTVFTQVQDGLVKQVMEALLITSGLLHFYYDGFIWKLKQPDTRQGLALGANAAGKADGPVWSSMIQAGLVLVGVVLLGTLELKAEKPDDFQKELAILRAVPESSSALNNVGSKLLEQGRYEEALPLYRKALGLQPSLDQARVSMSDTLALLAQQSAASGQADQALSYLREAVEVEANSAERHNDLAVLLAQLGRYQEAELVLRKALELDSRHTAALENLRNILQMQ